MNKVLSIFALLLISFSAFAQQNSEIEMADALRANGKIYIVVICIAIILLGLLGYLFAIDKRLKMLEKKSSTKN